MHGRTRDTAPPADGGGADPFSSGTSAVLGEPRPGAWFDASYSGECTGCWDVIDPGDRIRTDGTGGYLCEDCGNEDGLA